MKTLSVYWGCALTQAPPEYKEMMNRIMGFIKKYHPQVKLLEFLGTTQGTAKDVYVEDIGNVGSCDLFLNEVSVPSLGLGFEVSAGVLLYHKPVVSFVQKDVRLTRLLLGATFCHENYRVLEYSDEKELIQFIGNILYEKLQELPES